MLTTTMRLFLIRSKREEHEKMQIMLPERTDEWTSASGPLAASSSILPHTHTQCTVDGPSALKLWHRHFVGENRNKFSLRHWCGRWCILILFFSLFSLFFSILFAFGSVIKTIVRSEPNRQTIQQCAVHCRRRRHHRWNCTNWNFFLIVIFVFDVEIYPVSRREREKWNEREAIMKFTKRNFQVPLFGNSNNGISIWIEYAIRNLTQRKYKPKSN